MKGLRPSTATQGKSHATSHSQATGALSNTGQSSSTNNSQMGSTNFKANTLAPSSLQ